MRCSCGKPGIITLERRELPYCTSCFEELIVTSIRREAGHKPVRLQPREGYFLDAVTAACTLAKREVISAPDGYIPGCTETHAAATLRHMLGHSPKEAHFPKTITLQELQTFFKADRPVVVDPLVDELITLDKTYPGTTRSIAKQH